MSQAAEEPLVIHADGSLMKRNIGAFAALFADVASNEPVPGMSKAIHLPAKAQASFTSLNAELISLVLAVLVVEMYMDAHPESARPFVVNCDCRGALELADKALLGKRSMNCGGTWNAHFVRVLSDLIKVVRNEHPNIAISFEWVRGHAGNRGNMKANCQARKAARGPTLGDSMLEALLLGREENLSCRREESTRAMSVQNAIEHRTQAEDLKGSLVMTAITQSEAAAQQGMVTLCN